MSQTLLKRSTKNDLQVEVSTETIRIELNLGNEKVILGIISDPPQLDVIESKIIWEEIINACKYNNGCIARNLHFSKPDWTDLSGNGYLRISNVIQYLFSHFVAHPKHGNYIFDLI